MNHDRWRQFAPPLAAIAVLWGLLAASHTVWIPGRGLLDYRPDVISGDEPHYLLIVHSLLEDGDLALADDYAAVAAGQAYAGRAFAGVELDHRPLDAGVRGELSSRDGSRR